MIYSLHASVGDTGSTNGYLWVNICALRFGVQTQNKKRQDNNKEECKIVKRVKKDEKYEIMEKIRLDWWLTGTKMARERVDLVKMCEKRYGETQYNDTRGNDKIIITVAV